MISWPGRVWILMAIWFPMLPLGTKMAASRANISAARCSSRLTVGSSPYTSSPTSASAMARRISGVGRVTVSERRSTVGAAMAPGYVRAVGDTTEPSTLVALATELAEAAGALLAERLRTVRETVETKSSLTDMVTEVDRDAEALIVGRLGVARPDDAILGEEGGARRGTSGVRWIVDPL